MVIDDTTILACIFNKTYFPSCRSHWMSITVTFVPNLCVAFDEAIDSIRLTRWTKLSTYSLKTVLFSNWGLVLNIISRIKDMYTYNSRNAPTSLMAPECKSIVSFNYKDNIISIMDSVHNCDSAIPCRNSCRTLSLISHTNCLMFSMDHALLASAATNDRCRTKREDIGANTFSENFN